MSETKLIKIDSLNGKAPHVRHRAVVNQVKRPYWNGAPNFQILNSEAALTLCGRSLSNFISAENHSLNFTDGTVYAIECKGCFAE